MKPPDARNRVARALQAKYDIKYIVAFRIAEQARFGVLGANLANTPSNFEEQLLEAAEQYIKTKHLDKFWTGDRNGVEVVETTRR